MPLLVHIKNQLLVGQLIDRSERKRKTHSLLFDLMNSSDSSLRPMGESSIHNGANQEESPIKACFEQAKFHAVALMAAFLAIVVAALAGYKDIVELPLDSLTIATAIFLTLTFLSGYALSLYVNYNMSDCIMLTYWQYTLHVVLVSFGGVCCMITHVLLLALLNQVNAWLACFLVVVPFSIGILGYAGSGINGTNHLPRDKVFKSAMKSCRDVACLSVACAFLMHVGVVFVYYKNPSLRIYKLPPVDISVTFLALVLAEFSMMVTAMPLEMLPHAMRPKLLFLVKFLKYSMMFLTETAAMILGARFLDGLIFLALLLPIFVVIAPYLLSAGEQNRIINPDPENPERVDRDPNKINEEPDQILGMLVGVMNTCGGVLSAVYPLYTAVASNGNVYLRAGIFILVGLIGASLSWMAFPLNHSMNKQRAKVTKLVIGILMGLMTTIAAVFILKTYVDLYDQTSAVG